MRPARRSSRAIAPLPCQSELLRAALTSRGRHCRVPTEPWERAARPHDWRAAPSSQRASSFDQVVPTRGRRTRAVRGVAGVPAPSAPAPLPDAALQSRKRFREGSSADLPKIPCPRTASCWLGCWPQRFCRRRHRTWSSPSFLTSTVRTAAPTFGVLCLGLALVLCGRVKCPLTLDTKDPGVLLTNTPLGRQMPLNRSLMRKRCGSTI